MLHLSIWPFVSSAGYQLHLWLSVAFSEVCLSASVAIKCMKQTGFVAFHGPDKVLLFVLNAEGG